MAIDSLSAAGSFFGSASVDNIFAARLRGSSTPQQQAASSAVKAAQKEINRIRGYKINLTPADNQRLGKIQERIQEIQERASESTVRPDELEERAELFREADKILGKPSADVEADEVLEGLREQIDDLLAPRLSPAQANRLQRLTDLKEVLVEDLSDGEGSRTTDLQVQNVIKQINEINVPRQIHELSPAERTQYNDLVEQVNDYAGAKLVLNAREATRVYNLEKTISDLQASLPPDTSGEPTFADVARAYSRIG